MLPRMSASVHTTTLLLTAECVCAEYTLCHSAVISAISTEEWVKQAYARDEGETC